MKVKDLLILKTLYNGEVSRQQLMEIYLQDTVTLMSHLLYAKLVEKVRYGKNVSYKITEEGKRQFVSVMEKLLL